MTDSSQAKPAAHTQPRMAGEPVPIERPRRRKATKAFGLSMGDLLGLLDIQEGSIGSAAVSQSDSGVVLVNHERCGNLFLAVGMRIRCDYGDAEITKLNDKDATIAVLGTKRKTTLPIADLVFQDHFEIVDHH